MAAFTMVTDAMIQGLMEARASPSEIFAYMLVVRMESANEAKGRDPFDVFLCAELAEELVGMDGRAFSRALRGLTNKAFVTVSGECVPVLTQTSRGCKRHSPHFFDNLGEKISTGQYPT